MTYIFVSISMLLLNQFLLASTFMYIRKKYNLPIKLEWKHWFTTNLIVVLLLIGGLIMTQSLVDNEREELAEYSFLTGELLTSNPYIKASTTFIESSDPNNVYYYEADRMLREWIKNSAPVVYTYMLKKNVHGEYYFVLAPETDYNGDGVIAGKNEQRVPIGTIYKESNPDIEKAFRGNPQLEKTPTNDQWGRSISAFFPVKDHTGRTIAVIGIDYDAREYEQRIQHEQSKALIIILLFFAVYHSLSVVILKQRYESEYIKQKETEKQEHLQTVYHLAHRDELTGLENRKSFYETVNSEIAQAKRQSTSLLILFIRLDGANIQLNSYSYKENDQFILSMAKGIETFFAPLDGKISRWESHSFVVALPLLETIDHLPVYCEQLHFHLEQQLSRHLYSQFFSQLIMGGYAYDPLQSSIPDDPIKHADLACEFAIRHNQRTILFDEEVQAWADKRKLLEEDIQQAIDKGELVLHYQPQVCIRSGELIGVEALVRWQHRKLGLLSPAYFLGLAEETGMIQAIGTWVLQKACLDAKEMMERLDQTFTVSVNLSVNQVRNLNIVDQVRHSLQTSELDPTYLDLEVTETTIIDGNESIDVLHQLKSLGISISLDDFGSGYSSLSYLYMLPFNRIKLDRSFTQLIPTDANLLVKQIIQMGHQLNAIVLAEGVETKEQLDTLKSYQIDEVQGYYFSKPLPKEDINEELLTRLKKC